MKIRIVNLRDYKLNPGEKLIRVDRSTPLGNPYFMHDESERDMVCDKYQELFDEIMSIDQSWYYADFRNCVHQIILASAKHDIALGCWCYPKRCHAETIKNYVERVMEE
jgi:hypothetical protein